MLPAAANGWVKSQRFELRCNEVG